LFEAMEELFIA